MHLMVLNVKNDFLLPDIWHVEYHPKMSIFEWEITLIFIMTDNLNKMTILRMIIN